MADAPGVRQWATGVLRGLGKQPTEANVTNLVGWARAEGGHTNGARYNYLNTTQDMPGAGNTGTQGNIKVYQNMQQGVDATVRTLKNGRYGSILGSLDGSPEQLSSAIRSSPWGTHNDIASIIRQGGSVSPALSSPVSTPTSASSRNYTSSPSTTPTLVDPLADREGLVRSAMATRGGSLAHRIVQSAMSASMAAPTATGTTPGTPATSAESLDSNSPGAPSDLISQMNKMDSAHVPYQWGGGHARKILSSEGVTPMDCSGAVSRALGIDPRVSGAFSSYGQPGRGKQVTIWYSPKHVFMEVNGHFWGTSHANPGGGAGWIPASAVNTSGFQAVHPNGM